jgi:hypothetical protein
MYIYAIIDKLHEDTFFEKILLLKYEVGVLKIRRFGSAQRPDFSCPERSRRLTLSGVEGDKFLLPERSRRAQKFNTESEKIRRFGSAQRPDFPCPERSRRAQRFSIISPKIRRFGSAQRPDFPCPERSRRAALSEVEGLP